MPKFKLTDSFVRNAKSRPTTSGKVAVTEYADQTVRGLSLRVTPAGVKSWTYRYRIGGAQRRLSLGKVDVVSLAEARNVARVQIGIVASGGDPVKDRQLAKLASAENIGLNTVNQVWDFYIQECERGTHRPNARPKKKSTLDLEKYYFDSLIGPTLGRHRMDELRKAHIQKFVSGLGKSAAQRCRAILHSLYTFAQRNEIVETNPVQFVTTPAISARQRVLSDDELRTVWQSICTLKSDDAPMSRGVSIAIQLSIATLQRRGEIAGMKLSELDLERRLWVIPSSRTKNGRSHTVPLSDLAIDLVEAALSIRTGNGEYVFPSPKAADQPINPKAITRAFGRLRSRLKLGDIRPHDLRRTGATNLTGEELGFPRFIVSRVLNHSADTGNSAAVTSVYDRNEYLPEKRRALDAWALRLLEIVGGKARADNVVGMKHHQSRP